MRINGIEKRLFLFAFRRLAKEAGFAPRDIDTIEYNPKTGDVKVTATMKAPVEFIGMDFTFPNKESEEAEDEGR